MKKKAWHYLSYFIIISGAVIIVLNFMGCNSHQLNEKGVTVIQNDSVLEISNGKVKGRFVLNSHRISQTFYVVRGNRWELIAKSLDRTEHTGSKVMPLYDRGPGFANDFRLMVQEGLTSAKILQNNKEKVRILFSGVMGNNKIKQEVSLEPDNDYFHIEINALLPGNPPKAEYLLSSFEFVPEGAPDFVFTPSVKRSDDDLIGDRKFFAPATILEKNGLMMALVPDLDLINGNTVCAKGARPQKHPRVFAVPFDTTKISFPTAMDLCLNSGITTKPVISYGFIDYWVEQHVYWRHENENGAQVRELSDNKLNYGFDLFLKSGVEKYRGYGSVSSYLWKRYGTMNFHLPKPQAMPFSEYAKVCYPASFAYQGYDVVKGPDIRHRQNQPAMATWQQWDEKGIAMGGLRLSAPQWYQFIYNTAWWNNVCDATGIYYWGKNLNDPALLEKARRIIRLTLSAPQKDGLFPGLYNLNDKKWQPGLWNPPMEGYDPNKIDSYWGWDKDLGVYQTASASVTAGYLMYYRQFCENDPEILPYVQRYGDFLIRNMDPNGCIPGWFSKSLQPLPSLRWNADGGAHIWVLSELYRATKEKKYLDAAEKIADFMVREVMPHQKWYDFETFYSCAVKAESFYDSRTGQYPANNMSTSWALEGFASLFEVTGKYQYLAAAEAAADYSLFYQAIWAPNYIVTAYPFGGFSSQNSDAEWLDQRSHRFADGLVRIGLLSGREDLCERGVAATRASLTLINHPRHIGNNIYKYPNYPLGLGPENIDHEGFPQMPLRSGPSWCEVGGLAAAAHVMKLLGSVYINFERKIALGVDGIGIISYSLSEEIIRIEMKSLLSELAMPFNEAYTIDMHIDGFHGKNYDVVLNGAPAVKLTAMELRQLAVIVSTDGKMKIKINN